MKISLLEARPDRWLANVTILALFVVAGCVFFASGSGDDLASSYVGCRLIAKGQINHLYSFDPVSFAEIGEDDTWQNAADEGHFAGYLHPYVQTPLWGYALQPLCRSVYWPKFYKLFTILTMLSFAGCLWITARYWATSLYNPVALAIVALCLWFSQPFQYAMFLMQTHMMFIFLTLAGLLLAERKRPLAGGALVALAAAVKITPGLLVVYWLLTKKWKAALSMVICSAALWVITIVAVGHAVTATYLADLHRISRVLLVAQNNQSFAAWVMARRYPFDEVFDINIFPLPAFVRIAESILLLGCTVGGGFIDRWRKSRMQDSAPLGAMIVLIAATVFAPIAWTHYSVILVVPLMMLLAENRMLRSKWVWAAVVVIVVLNYRPIATDINHGLIGPLSIIRGQFYACVLTLAALGLTAWLTLRRGSDGVPMQHNAFSKEESDKLAGSL